MKGNVGDVCVSVSFWESLWYQSCHRFKRVPDAKTLDTEQKRFAMCPQPRACRLRFYQSSHSFLKHTHELAGRKENPVRLLKSEWFGTLSWPRSVKPTAGRNWSQVSQAWVRKWGAPRSPGSGVQRALSAFRVPAVDLFLKAFPSASNSNDMKWITVASRLLGFLGMGERLSSDGRTGIVEKLRSQQLHLLTGKVVGRKRAFSPSLWWAEEVGPLPCPFTVPVASSPSWAIHASHATSRGGTVGWTDRLASPPSRPLRPFPGQLGSPRPIWRGSPGPHPVTHCRQPRSWDGQGCVAPECTPGWCAAARGVGGGTRPWMEGALPISGSHRGWRHFWKPEAPGPTSGPWGGPRED